MKNMFFPSFVMFVAWVGMTTTHALAEEHVVGGDDGFETIGAAMAEAQEGDIITVRAGTYEETVETTAPGVALRAAEGAEVLVTQDHYVLRVRHERFTAEGITFDGQFSDRDVIQVRGEAHGLTLRNVEVRRAGSDCIDMGNQNDVLIEDSLIHHCLKVSADNCSTPDCREDAHGIAGAVMRNLTIRNTEIHTVSGDSIQLDAGRSEPGWSGLIIDGCRLWNRPLPEAVGGFAAGINPGENALDTKTSNDVVEPAEVTITNTEVWGWRNGLIGNMAAFNLKENVRVHLDRVTVYDSEIAFRLRGFTDSRPRGAQVAMANVVIYDVDTAIRYEDGIDVVRVDNTTIGGAVGRVFDDQSTAGQIEGRNVLVLADALPEQLAGGSNMAAGAEVFVDAAAHDYHLVAGATPIDAGEALADVGQDREGVTRPQGAGHDVGAYEFCDEACMDPQPEDDAGVAPIPDAGMPEADAEPNPEVDGSMAPDPMTDGGMPDATPGPEAGGDEGGCQTVLPGGSLPWMPMVVLVLGLLAIRRHGGMESIH